MLVDLLEKRLKDKRVCVFLFFTMVIFVEWVGLSLTAFK